MTGALILLATAGIDPMTVASDWGNASGGVPGTWTGAARAVTVPAGNPGTVRAEINSQSGDGTLQYRIDSGSYNTITDGMTFSITNGQALQPRLFGITIGGSAASVSFYDNTTSLLIGTATFS